MKEKSQEFKVNKKKAEKVFAKVKLEGRTNLLEEEGQEVLRAYGFPVPKSILATKEKEAIQAAKKIGYPVVMKIASPQIIHKSDAGGVKVGLKNPQEIKKAFKEIIKNAKKYDKKADHQRCIGSRNGKRWKRNDHWFKTRTRIWTCSYVWYGWNLC